jgi:hypothetical protein
MTVKDEGCWPWVRGFAHESLDPDLYAKSQVLATREGVQEATTVDEMIHLAGVPRELWYAPVAAPRPTVDPQEARTIAEQTTRLKETRTWGQVAVALGLSSVSAAMRVARGDVHLNEVKSVTERLKTLET